jgi:hypothetical protein
MSTLSKTHCGQRKRGWGLFRKRIWLRTLVLAGLGAMVVTVLYLFPGCSSDSTPGEAVKRKNAKIATRPTLKKMQARVSLLVDKEETIPGKIGKIKHHPESNFVEAIPGVTQEELGDRASADRKVLELPDTEVFPGMTQAELEAMLAKDNTSFYPETAEVFPNMTQARLDAQNAKQEVTDILELVPPAVEK